MKGYSQRICVLREKGAAAGLSGMTTDHLRRLLDNVRDLHMLFLVGEQLATVEAHTRWLIVRMGRSTAFTKPNKDQRHPVWRCGSQIGVEDNCLASERGAAPFQYALSTRSGQ